MKDNAIISVLGVEYKVKIATDANDNDFKAYDNLQGYSDPSIHTIAVRTADNRRKGQLDRGYLTCNDTTIEVKDTIRHEIIHAFMNESGLDAASTPWAHDESLINWLEIMIPRIEQAYKQALEQLEVTQSE